ncbi:MAG TPA: hypothetical protein VHD39_04625, partial [Acidimicrobiales bacterium]|nr:hypothetical protein [Acidimicrobiales bacterium]
MDLPTFAIPGARPDGIELSAEPAAGPGPRWVVARAEEELVVRYEFLAPSEQGLRAEMFDPPAGIFLVARTSGRPGADPVGGVGGQSAEPHAADRVGPGPARGPGDQEDARRRLEHLGAQALLARGEELVTHDELLLGPGDHPAR